jgi:hypothetical protein
MNIWIILLICLFVNLLMFIYFKWLINRRMSASGQLVEFKKEIDKLIADIDDATDRDSLLVEDRIRKLKQILEETDKRIAVYLRELDKTRGGEVLYTNLRRGIGAALKEGESGPDVIDIAPKPASVPEPTVPVQIPPSPQAPPPEAPPQPPTVTPAPVAQAPDGEKPHAKLRLRDQIEELYNEGFTAEQIASRLGRSIAEVELAITLLEKKTPSQ